MAGPQSEYITFKRDEVYQLFGELALPPWTGGLGADLDCAPIAENIDKRIRDIELPSVIDRSAATDIAGQIAGRFEKNQKESLYDIIKDVLLKYKPQ